ncbi:MAG: hypothetical protein HQ523_14815 [Lentisphaerae bacterium]|nr:hypothetical protein [Lentisphaerota bacterium]
MSVWRTWVVNGFVMMAMAALLFGCRPAPQAEPIAELSVPATQPGSAATAVLVPPSTPDEDSGGTRLGREANAPAPRSYVSLTQEKEKGLFHITLEDPHADLRDSGDGMVVRLRGGGARRAPGSPDIAGLVWVLPGKQGLNLIPTVTDAAFAIATQGVDIAAVAVAVESDEDGENDEETFERRRSADIYDQDALFPSHVIRVQESWVGTNKLVRLTVNPVQYNPVTKSLRLCYRLQADLEYVEALTDDGEHPQQQGDD